MKAKPFLKWAGGKSQLLEQIEKYYPIELTKGTIENYVEPFVGGGAMFFALSHRYKFNKIYLSDVNKDLVLTYQIVQQKAEQLLSLLAQYQKTYDTTEQEKRTDLFLNTRISFNTKKAETDYKNISADSVERAAQFIFLNKTCFNGLFRLNSKGEFNVPYGKYKTAMILDEANIMAVSKILQPAEIRHADYSACFERVNAGSFVYFDPPYRPISQTASFTTYTGIEFTDNSQLQLANFFKKLDLEKNAKLMLSNSDPKNENPNDDFFDKAYSGYNLWRVLANRAINCDGEKRGKVKELLITNYKHEPQALEFNF